MPRQFSAAPKLASGKKAITGGRIRPLPASAIGVGGRHARPRRAAGVEEVVAPVRVHGGDDVERALVNERLHPRQRVVVLHQEPDGVEADLPTLDLVAVDVGLDEHPCFAVLGTGVGVVDGHDPEVPSPMALPHGGDLEELGPGPGHELHPLAHLLVIQPSVPGEVEGVGGIGAPGLLGTEDRCRSGGKGCENEGGERGGRQESWASHDGHPHLRVTVAVS
jgi:hypothetical protein